MKITSASNPLLKEVRRAVARGEPTRDGCCVAESFHLLEEALRSDVHIQAVLVAESVRAAVENRVRGMAGLRLLVVPDALLETLAATENTQGVICLVRPPAWALEHVVRGNALVIVLDAVQDPGNAGAILRSAEAFGATGVLALKGTVNLCNPKAVRASAGSIFRVPFVMGLDDDAAVAALRRQRLDLYAACAAADRHLGQVDLRRRCAFIIGSEGRGVREKLRAVAQGLRIPISGVESLNAAVAAAILLYEARRQRVLP